MSDSIHTLPDIPVNAAHSQPLTHAEPQGPPPLPFRTHGWRWLKPAGYVLLLLLLNLVVPLVCFYSLRSPSTHLSEREVIGYSSISLGLSSCLDAGLRFWRLLRHPTQYAPLPTESHRFYEFDVFGWLYLAGLTGFTVLLVTGIGVPLYGLFLTSTALLVAPFVLFLALTMFLTPRLSNITSHDPARHSKGRRLPFALSSSPTGAVCPPGVLVLLEDLVCVDWAHGNGWRRALMDRYAASPGFRRLMYWQTVYWMIWGAVYIAVTSVVAWVAGITFAFGWCAAGSFFLFALLSGVGSYWLSEWGLDKERREWRGNAGEVHEKKKRRRRGVIEV